MSLNQELSSLFQTLAAVLEIKGESVFKAIAFSKVSRILGDSTADIRAQVEAGTLKDIEGIGDSSRKIIEEYVRTGRSTDADELIASVPAGLLPLLQIPGLGPKTIHLLWKERNILHLEDLVKALDSGALAGLKGIGAKKVETIKNGIALRAQSAGRLGIPEASAIGQGLVDRLRALPEVAEVALAGSLRRRRETIGDVDLLCAPREAMAGATLDSLPGKISAAFGRFPEVQRVLVQGITKASVLTVGGLQVDLRIVPQKHFGAALLYFTGSKEHNVKLRGRAIAQGMTLNEWGLYRGGKIPKDADAKEKETGKPPTAEPVASRTEADVYSALGLTFIEPELRESRGEMEAAERRTLPKLISLADIHGDLHSHTTASDGTNSIEEMAEAAKALGYQFLAITDHSKSQVIANGLSAERLLKHVEAIHRVGEKIKGITLLAGCEVDILVDGRLDFEDEVLAELDIVVASPHVSLSQDSAKATDRLLRAIEHPYVNIIGHPTGRLIDRRAGLPLDFDRLFAAAAKAGTAMEINAGYPRLDLSEIPARAAIAAGVKLSINTDAHATAEFQSIELGIGVARRAWAQSEDVINCFSTEQLLQFLRRKRP